ncbi:DUF2214 family protein [Chelativorans salis]|uniref:DUF2214 family protein n=1 Tax=Chelativorans salis TaxID=2978478 RepID=A0ABT2LNS2_9HYPH|nr:DUF2214 family protein [Chelativorans sp. EGI FJ00035]MCT7376211.1 DUF2214 family protein [Chelativorans sp. EGI FJ00035]
MLTDLLLAILHHLLVFQLAGVLAGEFVLMRNGLSGRNLKVLAHIDRMYGLLALAIIAIGVGRVIFGLKGWEYYVTNGAFWAKMAAFAGVGILSIRPTMRILKWSRANAGGDHTVPDVEIVAMRRFLKAEVAVFALIPIFAAMMARG